MSQALLDASVAIKEKRGMLGIAVSKHPGNVIDKQTAYVFSITMLKVDQQFVTIVRLFINRHTYASHTKPTNGAIFRIVPR